MKRLGYGCVYAALFATALVGFGCNNDDDTPVVPILDGRTYTEMYKCSQTFTGGDPFCADDNATDSLAFNHVSGNTYEVRDVPDTGFAYTGTLSGQTFTWTADSPDGYTEAGVWVFSSDFSTFEGASEYVADNATYAGECTTTGAEDPATPAEPPAIGACL